MMMEQKNDESEKVDLFERVKGIGPSMARQLRDAGVLTLAQLAAMTPEAVAAIVNGASILSVEREKWLEQAQALASQSGENQSVDDRLWNATFTVELLGDETSTVQHTRVEHIESGEKAKWAQWHADKLLTFIEESAGLIQSPPAAHLPNPIPMAESKSDLVGQPLVQVLTVTAEGETKPRKFVSVSRKIDLHLEVVLDSVQLPADTAVSYDVMVFARELAGRGRHVLGQSGGLLLSTDQLLLDMPGETPPPGTYRLEADLKLVVAVAGDEEAPNILVRTTTRVDNAYLHVFA